MITYTWTITKMECYAQSYGQDNVVCVAYWTLSGNDGYYQGSVSGTQGLIYNGTTPFTPYANLSEQQVIDWVTGTMGESLVNTYQYDVETIINNKTTPVIVTPPLPWKA